MTEEETRPVGRSTSLDGMGISDKFRLPYQSDEVEYSDLISLPGLVKDGEEKITDDYILGSCPSNC